MEIYDLNEQLGKNYQSFPIPDPYISQRYFQYFHLLPVKIQRKYYESPNVYTRLENSKHSQH